MKREANDFIQCEIIWPPIIQVELTISRDRSTDHIVMLFNSEQQVFQVNIPIKPGVVKEIKQTIRLNDKTYTSGK